jgi:hypothetical protein
MGLSMSEVFNDGLVLILLCPKMSNIYEHPVSILGQLHAVCCVDQATGLSVCSSFNVIVIVVLGIKYLSASVVDGC